MKGLIMDYIRVKGARQNNLQNVNVDIPENSFTVFTGVSGSGKSSLAYDVIYAEGQRRFLQTMNTSASGIAMNMMKPDVDLITGLTPVMSISQKKGNSNPRSTVASVADLSNYIRLLFAIEGKAVCPYCERGISTYSVSQITEYVLNHEKNKIIYLYSPVFKRYDETYDEMVTRLRDIGCHEYVIDDIECKDNIDVLADGEEHKVEVFVGKVRAYKENYNRILHLFEKAFSIGENFARIESGMNELDHSFSKCKHHMLSGVFYHKNFSSNDISGACPTCEGLGKHKVTEPWLLIKDDRKTLRENPLYISQFSFSDRNGAARLYSLSAHYDFSIDIPFSDLSDEVKEILFYGTKGEMYEILKSDGSYESSPRYVSYEGLIPYVTRMRKKKAYQSTDANENLFKTILCPACQGSGIKQERTFVMIKDKDIRDVFQMSISELILFFQEQTASLSITDASMQIYQELLEKLNTLEDIGLGYLSLGRRTDTLSGGEYQRIRIAAQIGSNLKGLTYVIDEPSIGLHERDTFKMIEILKHLKETGNTLLIVEHDLETIKQADFVVEMGPGAGNKGGKIIATGAVKSLMDNEDSIIGKYMSEVSKIQVPLKHRLGNGHMIRVYGAAENNLKHIDVNIPLGKFVCITGVSGSGKSTFVNEVLYKAIAYQLLDKRVIPGKYDYIEGLEYIKDIRYIDQSPIGKSSRSNPCTYLGIYNQIRKIFADTPAAQEKDYDMSYFSFNNKGGRCENCFGEGTVVTELKFMQDMMSVCPVCSGRRFSNELLMIKYMGLSISDVLDLMVSEAVIFFNKHELICKKLQMLEKLGLGYLKLGQASSTLSGGEAQRLKLAKELSKQRIDKNVIYVLDEPTTGLHIKDIESLLKCLNEIVEQENTVLVIEHNMDVIKTADYIIDFGREAGDQGGNIIASGTPEEIVLCKESYTGRYLKKYLQSTFMEEKSCLIKHFNK